MFSMMNDWFHCNCTLKNILFWTHLALKYDTFGVFSRYLLLSRNTVLQLLALTPTLRATMHSITDGPTDGRTTWWCQWPIILCSSTNSFKLMICRLEVWLIFRFVQWSQILKPFPKISEKLRLNFLNFLNWNFATHNLIALCENILTCLLLSYA